MNFQLTEDRRMLADTLARFVREQYDFDQRQTIAASPAGASRALWSRFAELGTLAALFPEAQGGMGGSGFDIAVVFEALGRGLVVEPMVGALMAGRVLGAAGRQAELDALMAGEKIILLAHEEAGIGFDAAAVGMRAVATGAGWLLSGSKAAVQGAELADGFVVSARITGEPGDADGVALFHIPAGCAGLTLQAYALIDGGRGAELRLDRVSVAADAMIGTVATASAALTDAIGAALVALAAESLGAMEVAKAATVEHLRTRRQFGVPIGSFQALQHRMADLLLEVEQARSALINAAAALDGPPGAARERALSAAKYTVGRTGIQVAEECVQLHGGIGMTWELPFAHVAKRLVMIDHQLGDEDQHLQRYISLGRQLEVA